MQKKYSSVGRKLTLLAALSVLVLSIFNLSPAHIAHAATTWTVTTLADDAPGGTCGATCTLRDALSSAQNSDTIQFQTGLSGTIDIHANGTLNINTSVTINGPGASVMTVSGGNAVGVFNVASGTTVSINEITISNGNISSCSDCGGGIYNAGTLNISNSVVANNVVADVGGAIDNRGTLTVSNSTISNNSAGFGGAIFNWNMLTISGSTFSGNSGFYVLYEGNGGAVTSVPGTILSIANSVFSNNSTSGFGGAITSGGILTISDSVFSNNSAEYGGGIYNNSTMTVNNTSLSSNSGAFGGAIDNDGTLTVDNTTFSNNSANNRGGVIENGTTLILSNSTLFGNHSNQDGGGIWNQGKATVSNSTIAGNFAANGGGVLNYSPDSTLYLLSTIVAQNRAGVADPDIDSTGIPAGAVSSLGHNLIGDGTGSGLVNGANNDQVGTAANPIDPMLSPLGDYGGPTQTMLLSANGPAYQKGDCTGNMSAVPPAAAVTTDQRGVNRKSLCDIGAFEVAAGVQLNSIGIFRPSANAFFLRLHNSTGFADIAVNFNPAAKPYPVVGDWTGAGYDTVGIFDQANGQFTLCIANDSTACANSANQIAFVLGTANDMPFSGKWTNGAATFGIGVFRPSNGLIYLKNALITGFADNTMVLGIPGDVGLAGDWNSDGIDSPGAYRPSNQRFYLTDQVCNCAPTANYVVQYGIAGDTPVVGDWIGQGHDGIGLFRATNGYTYLKNQLTTGYADLAFTYGVANDIPIAGHWQSVYPPVPNLRSVFAPPTSAPMPTNSGLGSGGLGD